MSTVRAYLIYNPKAGQIWSAFQPEIVCKYLSQHGWQVTPCPTDYAGHGSDLARQAVKDGQDIVIAAGGDGTINEVIQGLAQTNTKLGILPAGTTNVLARELKIPLTFQEALTSLPTATPFQVDLGKVNHRFFMLMAGIGYDAEVVRDINPQLKALTGKSAVVTSGVLNLFHHKPFKVKIRCIDAQGKKHVLRRSVMQIFVFNAATYATDFKIAAEAQMNDGVLELLIFKSRRFQDTFKSLLALLLRRHREWTDLEQLAIGSVHISSKKPAPLQIDGDTIGTTPINIVVVPHALTLLRPAI